MADPSNKLRTVICVGDIHGYLTKLLNLWSNLQSQIDPDSFNTATIIFLGDYFDRGLDTRKVIEFLISLPKRYPNQKHVFLSGNHEFAFAGFIGVLAGEFEAKETWKEYAENEEIEGWYKGEGYKKMHLQGRIWGGWFDVAQGIDCKGAIFDAAPTFGSYGVTHGSSELMKVVPEDHKKFLADVVWVHEELEFLKAKDVSVPQVTGLSGKKNVSDIPEELTETVVVSGHHGKLHIEGLRLIIDESGGLEGNPLAAIVLPSMKIVRDTDNLS
ncbi:hypothetical protein E1A91_A04G083500v1 [Gossypium mustelinum]|uniref:Calcineurin-like phosphoesterase domain-containing protein n=1 Tax=Gossypium mustelinum TaxID=34275 RepID=A0A5D2ZPQ4_GOSMU|nr:hypothetical protein E1A91_A04G083500v1 [Gossypium mustelinum]